MSAETPPLELPPDPSLEQLKKQAKDLRRASRAGRPEALERVRKHLPRLGNRVDADAGAVAEVSLQECQHVVAVEYGFKEWKLLATAVDTSFGDLARLSDRDAQVLMREVDQKDLVIALKGGVPVVKEKFLQNMSARVRGFIESEIELTQADAASIKETRCRMLGQIRDLTRRGLVAWDGGSNEKGVEYGVRVEVGFFDLVSRPLDQMTIDDMGHLWRQIAEQARAEGILSLQQFEAKAASPLVREALQLAVDGTEPALIEDLLQTRSRTLLRHLETRAQMVSEGLLAIMAGDNPAVVAHKLSAFYGEYPAAPPEQANVASLTLRLQDAPATLDFAGLNDLLSSMALVAREEGIPALGPLVALLARHTDAESELLRCGLEMMLAEEDWGTFLGALGTLGKTRRAGLAAAHRMVVAGIGLVQAGKKPEEIEARVREEGRAPA